MYNSHFGLHRSPFKITPDTSLFFKGGQRGRVLEALVYAVVSGEGIIKVVGEVGTGKTMLCRMLHSELPSNVEIVYLANPSLEPGEIHHAIALELGLTLELSSSKLEVLYLLQQHLLDKYARNQHVVVLVEEAQGMPKATLEEIRLLSNLETRQDKLLQVVLFGQPELDTMLQDPSIRQLRERITHSFRLAPLEREEVREYVNFRLRSAGFRGRDVFDERAYAMLASASRGLSRRINILADKALLAAFAEDTHDVKRRHVKVAVDDSQMSRRVGAARPWGRWPEALAAGGGLVLLTALVLFFVAPSGSRSDLAPPHTTAAATPAQAGARAPEAEAAADASVAGADATTQAAGVGPARVPDAAAARGEHAGEAAPAAAAEPAPGAAAEGPGRAAISGGKASVRDPDSPAGGGVAAQANSQSGSDDERAADTAALAAGKLVADAERVTRRVVPGTESSPAAEAQDEPGGGIEATLAERGVAVAGEAPASGDVTGSPRQPLSVATPGRGLQPERSGTSTEEIGDEPDENVVGKPPGTLLDERVAAAVSWVEQQPTADKPSRYSIQIMVSEAANRVPLERFLRQRSAAGDLNRIYCYPGKLSGRPVFTVFYGEFDSFQAASQALLALPSALRTYRPYVRNIGQLAARARRELAAAFVPFQAQDGRVARAGHMRYAHTATKKTFSESET